MTPVTRMFLIVLLMLPMVGGLAAQEPTTDTTTTTTATAPAAATATVTDTTAGTETETAAAETDSAEPAGPPTSYTVRQQFTSLVHNSAPDLARVLALQPNLLTNAEFMASYPEVAQFVAEHPEVKNRPRFFLAEFADQPYRQGPIEQIVEPLAAMFGIGFVAVALAWLVRTWIEQRRWNKLSKTQAEVHNKILDRFGTSAELMEYIKTPAGTRFLESAPIPLRAERPAQSAPHARVVLSIQLGVIVASAALGMLLVSLRYSDDSGEGLFALGAIALCIGLGFIASAFVTLALSRRLGLWQGQQVPFDGDEPGLVR
jgi:hypothetical protein